MEHRLNVPEGHDSLAGGEAQRNHRFGCSMMLAPRQVARETCGDSGRFSRHLPGRFLYDIPNPGFVTRG